MASRVGVSRSRVLSASCSARFLFSAFCIALMPTSIGYQDLASLVAHERGASTGWHLIASPLGTVQAATFNYTRPIGTTLGEAAGLINVNFDPRTLDAYAWKIDEPITVQQQARQIEYPSVNRARKGDRLPANNITPAGNPASLPQLQPVSAPAGSPPSPAEQPASPPAVTPPPPAKTEQHAESNAAAPLVVQADIHHDVSTALAPAVAAATGNTVAAAQATVGAALDDSDEDTSLDEMSFLDENAADRSAAVYFGTGVLGSREGLQSWAPGAAPILVPPSDDSGIKLSALEGADYSAGDGGESVAGKDDPSLMESPAHRLGLEGNARAHAEKCLSEAIYFEARGEPYQGQEAVAQVVMNRVFSGYYPHDVCGVVFQAKYRHPICQFSFACEGKNLNHIEEPDMWEQAKEIAKHELDGKIWLADIGHATHYHAYWVHPSWVHEMVRLYKLGVHTFYRPRAWGDDEPTWSPAAVKDETQADKPQAAAPNVAAPAAAAAAAAAPSPAPAAKGPQAAATPADGKGVQTAKL